MKRRVLIILMILLLIFASSCHFPKEKENDMYTFEKITDSSKIIRTSKIMNLISGFPQNYIEQCVLIQGKLLNLFGEPLYESVNIEEQYDYIIAATSKSGETYYLHVYNGPSGPAIGADSSIDGIEPAALALKTKIQAATPSDFSYEGYYPDTMSKISSGISDGKVYYSETPVTDPDEIEEMLNKIYGSDK